MYVPSHFGERLPYKPVIKRGPYVNLRLSDFLAQRCDTLKLWGDRALGFDYIQVCNIADSGEPGTDPKGLILVYLEPEQHRVYTPIVVYLLT
jgi:hypothetical protein